MSPDDASLRHSDAKTSFQTSIKKYLNADAPASPKASSVKRTIRQGSLKRKAPGSDEDGDLRPASHGRGVKHSKAKQSNKSPIRRKTDALAPTTSLVNNLVDSIEPNLILLFIGLNPGIMTATTGHAYAHPTNHFWPLLHKSGITPIRRQPSDTPRLPGLYSLGNTNIVSRPSRDGSTLSKQEMWDGVPLLEDKIRRFKPEAVCIVGKSIWQAVWRVKKGSNLKEQDFHYGWQSEALNMGKEDGWKGAKVFVATTTSGLAATLRPAEKEAIWQPLGEWVKQRRNERGLHGDGHE